MQSPTEKHAQLEQQAATILGYVLFEYTRLDMELGLFLVWSEEGRSLELLTKKVDEYNFAKRLSFLEELVLKRYFNTPAADLYAEWLNEAHEARLLRNKLFHGRWGFMPQKQMLANVIGLPTSPEQAGTHYSLEQLQNFLDSIRALRARLNDLRKKWPV